MSRQPFNTRWAQGVETEDNLNTFKEPGGGRISQGWEGGQDKDAPPAGQENWWHNRVDTALQGVERNGVMAWHPQAVYEVGAPSYGLDGNYYESLTSSNIGNNPISTVGFWRFIGSSFFSGADPGDIKSVAHNDIPSAGWLKCNGALVLRSSYPRLFDKIGTLWNTGDENITQFRLPDFRGEFLRGFDDGRGIDPQRTFASKQKGTGHIVDIGGAIVTLGDRVSSSNPASARSIVGLDTVLTSAYSGMYYSGSLSNEVSQVTNSSEVAFGSVRPTNMAINFWIKY